MYLFTELSSHKVTFGIKLVDELLKFGSFIKDFSENFTELPDFFDGKPSMSIIKDLPYPWYEISSS